MWNISLIRYCQEGIHLAALHHLILLLAVGMSSGCSVSCQHLALSVFPPPLWWLSSGISEVLSCNYLMTNDVEHYWICLSSICQYVLMKFTSALCFLFFCLGIHLFFNQLKKFFELTIDSHAVIRNNTERFCIPFTQILLMETSCIVLHGTISQLGCRHQYSQVTEHPITPRTLLVLSYPPSPTPFLTPSNQ